MEAPDVITVSSPAFRDGQPIPARFTCDGAGEAPPLVWSGVPDGAAALSLVVDDPDAPRGTFVHWVVLDLPAAATGLPGESLPAGTVQARNSAGRASYFGPCPPSGSHHYRFTVYALSERTGCATAPTSTPPFGRCSRPPRRRAGWSAPTRAAVDPRPAWRGYARRMSRGVAVGLGVLLVVVGAVWTLQGLGYVGGSAMSGVALWAVVGPVVVILGLLLAVRGGRKRS